MRSVVRPALCRRGGEGPPEASSTASVDKLRSEPSQHDSRLQRRAIKLRTGTNTARKPTPKAAHRRTAAVCRRLRTAVADAASRLRHPSASPVSAARPGTAAQQPSRLNGLRPAGGKSSGFNGDMIQSV